MRVSCSLISSDGSELQTEFLYLDYHNNMELFCSTVLFACIQLDPSIFESLQKERVETGDVIYIEANSGAVKVKEKFCTFMQVYVFCRPFSDFFRRLSDLLTLTDMIWLHGNFKKSPVLSLSGEKSLFCTKESGGLVHN